MPDPQTPSPANPVPSAITSAWVAYTNAVRPLLQARQGDRPLEQYLQFRDTVMVLVQSPAFPRELESCWPTSTDHPRLEVGNALLMELAAFPHAVEVATTTATSDAEKQGWFQKLLGRASTVAGSVDDIMDGLPPMAKGAIKLFRELGDLLRGAE